MHNQTMAMNLIYLFFNQSINQSISFIHQNRTHTHTTVSLLFWNMSGTTRVSRYQKRKTRKVKTNLDLLEQEIVSGSGICWAICKSAPHHRQPRQHPTTQFFTGRIPFCRPTNSVKALKAEHNTYKYYKTLSESNGRERHHSALTAQIITMTITG